MTYRLSDEEREALYRAGDHHPDHCDCSAYVIEQAFAVDDCCEALLRTEEVVEAIVAREVAARLVEVQAKIGAAKAEAGEWERTAAECERLANGPRRGLSDEDALRTAAAVNRKRAENLRAALGADA